jgi:hypothetical protein
MDAELESIVDFSRLEYVFVLEKMPEPGTQAEENEDG